MKDITQVVKPNSEVKPLTDQDRCDLFNETLGELHLVDGIVCEKCRNRGHVYVLKDNEIIAEKCECMKQRKIMKVIINSGLQNDFQKNTFRNFIVKESWERAIKETALDYVKNHRMDGLVKGEHWFLISGQVGSGKTHICTAISSELIKQGYDFKYLAYAREFPKLQIRLKNFNVDVNEQAKEELNRLMTVKVLYIDDFLKVGKDDNIFELIDTRYSQEDLITIISTEKTWEELMRIDEAIASRIRERTTNEYYLEIEKFEGRNKRLKHER